MDTKESLESLNQEERKNLLAKKNGQLHWRKTLAGYYRTFESGFALEQPICSYSGKKEDIRVVDTKTMFKIFKKRTPEVAF
jgi:hypothetical protein